MKRLRSESIDQLLCILGNFFYRHKSGQNIPYAYREAVNFTAKKYLVRYQTIGDLCRRRLGLVTVGDFHNYLREWVAGDGVPLKRLLFDHAATHDRQKIEEFFHLNGQSSKGSTGLEGATPQTQLSIELSSAVLGNLRKLADSENKSLSEYSANIVTQHVLKLLASQLKETLKGLSPPEREKLLRELETNANP